MLQPERTPAGIKSLARQTRPHHEEPAKPRNSTDDELTHIERARLTIRCSEAASQVTQARVAIVDAFALPFGPNGIMLSWRFENVAGFADSRWEVPGPSPRYRFRACATDHGPVDFRHCSVGRLRDGRSLVSSGRRGEQGGHRAGGNQHAGCVGRSAR